MSEASSPPAMTGPQHWRKASELLSRADYVGNSAARSAMITAAADAHARLAVGALLGEALYEELSPEWAAVLR